MTHFDVWEGLFVDGEPVATDDTVHVTWGGTQTAAGTKGQNTEVPGRKGVLFTEKQRAAGQIVLDLELSAANAEGLLFEQRVEAIHAAFERLNRLIVGKRRRPLALTRVRPLPNGKSEQHSASAEYSGRGLELDMDPAGVFATVEVPLTLLDGCWYDDTPRRLTLTAGQRITAAVPGTTDTDRISIELTNPGNSLGLFQVLTNWTAETWLGYQWSTDSALFNSSKVALDVEQFTSMRHPTDGSDPVVSLTRIRHAGAPEWLLLHPGDNDLELAGGRAVIEYRAAYL